MLWSPQKTQIDLSSFEAVLGVLQACVDRTAGFLYPFLALYSRVHSFVRVGLLSG